MQSILKRYSENYITPKIITDHNNSEWFGNFKNMNNDQIKDFLQNTLYLGRNIRVVFRDILLGEKYELNWHLDDRVLQKHPLGISRNLEIIYKNDKYEYGLWKSTAFSLIETEIIYLSTYGKDFTGGQIEFQDTIIKPFCGLSIRFDKNQLHRVLPVRSGSRKAVVIKFYE